MPTCTASSLHRVKRRRKFCCIGSAAVYLPLDKGGQGGSRRLPPLASSRKSPSFPLYQGGGRPRGFKLCHNCDPSFPLYQGGGRPHGFKLCRNCDSSFPHLSMGRPTAINGESRLPTGSGKAFRWVPAQKSRSQPMTRSASREEMVECCFCPCRGGLGAQLPSPQQ